MGICGDRCAEKYRFSREQQDGFAIASFNALRRRPPKVFSPAKSNRYKSGRKETVTVAEDENPKKFNEDKLRKLASGLRRKGTVTAGNASSINDGAAAIVALSPRK